MSVFSPSIATAITSPPMPPSPPFGPPYSMNFSRRNDTQPLPAVAGAQIDLGLVEEFHFGGSINSALRLGKLHVPAFHG